MRFIGVLGPSVLTGVSVGVGKLMASARQSWLSLCAQQHSRGCAVSLSPVAVARRPSAPEKQPQRLVIKPLNHPDTSMQASGERTVCTEPARSIRV